MALSKVTSSDVPVLIERGHGHVGRAAALEGKGEGARFRVEGDLAELDDRPPLDLDGADQERGAERGRRHACGRQRPQAPVAVLRVEHQHLLAAHGADHPDLDGGAGPSRRGRRCARWRWRAPESREGEADDPEVDLLVERGALGRLRRVGRRRGIAARGATGPVGLVAVALERADVGGMGGLDAEAAHVLEARLSVTLSFSAHSTGSLAFVTSTAQRARRRMQQRSGPGEGHRRACERVTTVRRKCAHGFRLARPCATRGIAPTLPFPASGDGGEIRYGACGQG